MTTPSSLVFPPLRLRLIVLGFVCSLSLLTYLDRVCIARVGQDIQRDLAITPEEMGLVFGAFLLGYGLFEIPGGWLGDRWGTRYVLAVIVLWWSLFTALTGYVWPFRLTLDNGVVLFDSLMLLLLIRFTFGAGEAGAFPNLSRLVGVWFPFRERALAQGSIWFSARMGGAVAPLIIGRLTVAFGWRQAFAILGVLGLAWAATFFWWFRDNPAELMARGAGAPPEEIADSKTEETTGRNPANPHSASGHAWPPLRDLTGSLTLWALCVAAFGVSFGWYFYPTWQPKYLEDVYGISYADSEILTGLPFLCGALGCLVGGGLSDALIARTGNRRWGRSVLGLVGFGGAGLCVLATGYTTQAWQAVLLLCLAFLINDLAIPVIWAVSADIGGRYVGTVAGIMNTAGAVGGLLSPVLIPRILSALPTAYSVSLRWQIIFAGLAVAWFISAAAWLFVDASKPLFRKDEG